MECVSWSFFFHISVRIYVHHNNNLAVFTSGLVIRSLYEYFYTSPRLCLLFIYSVSACGHLKSANTILLSWSLLYGLLFLRVRFVMRFYGFGVYEHTHAHTHTHHTLIHFSPPTTLNRRTSTAHLTPVICVRSYEIITRTIYSNQIMHRIFTCIVMRVPVIRISAVTLRN